MDQGELERRRPVWNALSDVFLDTETRWYFPRAAWVLAESGYSQDELEGIWRQEMVPEFGWNLTLVAGEWAGFAIDEKSLQRRARSKPHWISRCLSAWPGRIVKAHWEAILKLRTSLLSHPEANRPLLVEAWSSFAKGYLETSLGELITLETNVDRLRTTGWSRAMCEEVFQQTFRPIYAGLLIGEERNQESSRADNVLELIGLAYGDREASNLNLP